MSEERCPVCGGHGGDNWFDRSFCPEPCGSMHTRCVPCGAALDGCPFEDEPGQSLLSEADVLRDRLAVVERERDRLQGTLRAVEQYAFATGVSEWMHFHELAMTDPFKAESVAQKFAFSVQQMASDALAHVGQVEPQPGRNRAEATTDE